jgi:hypothetical protein
LALTEEEKQKIIEEAELKQKIKIKRLSKIIINMVVPTIIGLIVVIFGISYFNYTQQSDFEKSFCSAAFNIGNMRGEPTPKKCTLYQQYIVE